MSDLTKSQIFCSDLKANTDYIYIQYTSLIIIPECVFIVCVWEISEQLNQENGMSYGTGFFGKVQI